MSQASSGRAWLGPFYANTVLVQAITFVLRPTAIYKAIELDVAGPLARRSWRELRTDPTLAGSAEWPRSGPLWRTQRHGRRGRPDLHRRSWLRCHLVLCLGPAGVVPRLGLGHLCSVVGQQALVANRIERARYDTAFGHYTFAASAGQAIGPGLIVLFGGAASIPDTGSIFGWTILIGAVLMVTTLFLPSSPTSRESGQPITGSVRDLLRRPGLIRALAVSCIVLAAVDISLIYLPLLGTERGIAAGTIGILLSIRAATSMTSRFFLGRLAAWVGRGRLLTLSIAIAAVSMALVPIPMPMWLLAVLVAALGLGLGVGQPITMSWLAEATPPGLRGRAMSLRLTGNRLGQVVVPSAAGLLAVGAGAAGVLWLTAGALVVVGVAARRITRNTPPSSLSPTT